MKKAEIIVQPPDSIGVKTVPNDGILYAMKQTILFASSLSPKWIRLAFLAKNWSNKRRGGSCIGNEDQVDVVCSDSV